MELHLEQRIAAELRAELARQGHSRHWLADQTGLPVTTVARWLRGASSPRLNELDAICQAFGMTIADLLLAVEKNGAYQRIPIPAGRATGGLNTTDTAEASGVNIHQSVPLPVAA